MKKGNLSNVPAPYVIIDGESLYEFSWFTVAPKREYIEKLEGVIRSANISIYLDQRSKLTKRDIEKSPFSFTDILVMDHNKFMTHLRKTKNWIFCSSERMGKFSGRSVPIDTSPATILAEVGL